MYIRAVQDRALPCITDRPYCVSSRLAHAAITIRVSNLAILPYTICTAWPTLDVLLARAGSSSAVNSPVDNPLASRHQIDAVCTMLKVCIRHTSSGGDVSSLAEQPARAAPAEFSSSLMQIMAV